MKEDISVVSTYAQDILVREATGEILSRQRGGPMFFIVSALEQAGVPYRVFHGDDIDVKILITDQGERGGVLVAPAAMPFPASEVSNWVMVSTLLQEWDLAALREYHGRAFVDLQGYVRNADDPSAKREWDEAADLSEWIFCMKGTREEVDFLPEAVREAQKQRVLIATDGSRGVELYYQGTRYYLPIETPLAPRDTIGAGDTFFGWFVAEMYKGADPQAAATEAMKRTTEFLSRK